MGGVYGCGAGTVGVRMSGDYAKSLGNCQQTMTSNNFVIQKPALGLAIVTIVVLVVKWSCLWLGQK